MKKALFLLVFLAISISVFGDDVPNLYRTELFTYGGIPVKDTGGPEHKVLVNMAYAVGYSETLKNPVWVVYCLGNMKKEFFIPKGEWLRQFQIDHRTKAIVEHDD